MKYHVVKISHEYLVVAIRRQQSMNDMNELDVPEAVMKQTGTNPQEIIFPSAVADEESEMKDLELIRSKKWLLQLNLLSMKNLITQF